MPTPLDRRAAAVRHFNRFYTRRIGVLQEHLLDSPFSLTEVRLLYELAHRDGPTASELATDLGLDPGYLSRTLRRFERRGLITRAASASDGRRSHLNITKRGREAFAPLDARSHDEVAGILRGLTASHQRRLLDAMHTIEALLGQPAPREAAYLLRPHQPGDMGWVVHRHGALYAHEFGWDERFEALVAEVVAEFLQNYDAKRERCWIAEKDGEIVGSVFLVRKTATIAKLRLLLVEPSARGLGIGKRLVDECIRFATQAGYRTMVLWTQKELQAARHIYAGAGFRLAKSERHRMFGPELTAETWELRLPRLTPTPRRNQLRPSSRSASS